MRRVWACPACESEEYRHVTDDVWRCNGCNQRAYPEDAGFACTDPEAAWIEDVKNAGQQAEDAQATPGAEQSAC